MALSNYSIISSSFFFNHYKMFISNEKKTTEQADWYSFFINIMHILWSHLSLCKCVLDHFTGQFIHVHKWNYNGHKSKIYCFLFEIWIVLKSSCKQIKSYQNQKSYNKPINNNSLNMNYSMGFKEKEYRNEKKTSTTTKLFEWSQRTNALPAPQTKKYDSHIKLIPNTPK